MPDDSRSRLLYHHARRYPDGLRPGEFPPKDERSAYKATRMQISTCIAYNHGSIGRACNSKISVWMHMLDVQYVCVQCFELHTHVRFLDRVRVLRPR